MLTQCIAACLTSEATKIVRALPLYGKKLVDWHVSIRTVCIQLQKLNVILSVYRKIMTNFHNRDKSQCFKCFVLYTSHLKSCTVSANNWGKSNAILFVLRAVALLPYREPNE